MTTKRASRLLCLALLATAPSCSLAETGGASVTKKEATQPQAGRELSPDLKRWHPYDPAWARDATVIVKGVYHHSSYPCVFFPDGMIARPARFTFDVGGVLRGNVACPSIDANLGGLDEVPDGRFPHSFVDDRTYLLFLKPNAASSDRLKDPKARFTDDTQLARSELVAIADLSQTEQEAAAMGVPATRSATRDGFTFTPEKWAALRKEPGVKAEDHRRFTKFIRDVVATPGASLGDVRAYLGEPDSWHRNTDGVFYRYDLNRPVKHPVVGRKGQVAGSLEMSFSPELKLQRSAVSYLKCKSEDEHGDTWEELTPEELAALGVGGGAK